jgi:hypothetical protein
LLDPESYIYFGFNTASLQFVPAAVDGYEGPVGGILAATDGFKGFFIAPLPGQPDPVGTRSDGLTAAYDPYVSDFAVTQVNAVPEASTWAMMILGFAGIGILAYRRRKIGLAV